MRRDPLEVQERDGIQVGGRDQRFDPVQEILIILEREILAHAVTRGNLLHSLFRVCPVNEMICIFRGGGVELQDDRCIENEDTRAVGLQS